MVAATRRAIRVVSLIPSSRRGEGEKKSARAASPSGAEPVVLLSRRLLTTRYLFTVLMRWFLSSSFGHISYVMTSRHGKRSHFFF